MRDAMSVLRKVDARLYKEANVEEDPRKRSPAEAEMTKKLSGQEKKALESRIRGLFPRELRLPTDTPPRDGWNHEFVPVIQLP